MEPDVLSIFYSTIALSMATIIAFGGIFTIYRLQEINNEIANTSDAFKEYYRRIVLNNLNNPNREKDSQESAEWLNKDVLHKILAWSKTIEGKGLPDYFTQLNNQIEFRDSLQENIKTPTRLITETFFLSIFSFLLLKILQGYCLFIWLITLIILTLYTVLEVLKYIRRAIRGPVIEHLNNPLTDDFSNLTEKRFAQIKKEIESKILIEKEKIKNNLEQQIKKYENADK